MLNIKNLTHDEKNDTFTVDLGKYNPLALFVLNVLGAEVGDRWHTERQLSLENSAKLH